MTTRNVQSTRHYGRQTHQLFTCSLWENASRNIWIPVLIPVSVALQKNHILKELCGRGHWCVPPSIHLFCSAGSRQVIQYIWVITADVKAELTAFVYYISHQILLFSSTSRIISGGGLPWQYPAPLPACTRKNSPSTAEILRGKPAAGFKLLALHNTAK